LTSGVCDEFSAGLKPLQAESPALSISLVLPTHNRAEALRETFPSLLDVEEIREIIVVDDGSTDDTLAFLGRQTDSRIRVIRHSSRRGLPAARNTGIAAATSDWVLFGEDDCLLPRDYAVVLLGCAGDTGAQIVGAPWLHCEPGRELEAYGEAQRNTVASVGLDSHPSSMPEGPIATPFGLSALVLIRRDLSKEILYDEGYTRNAYREETDFIVSATRLGYTCVVTPETFSYQSKIWAGGVKTRRLAYENATLRNNWRFLKKHGRWLSSNGYIKNPYLEQASFALRRFSLLMCGAVRARITGCR